jgi:hypothetical protein
MRLGFEPDERQVTLLRSEAKQGILNCSRQWGKSTEAVRAEAEYSGARDGHNKVSVRLPNGSRIVGLPPGADVDRRAMAHCRGGKAEYPYRFHIPSEIVDQARRTGD